MGAFGELMIQTMGGDLEAYRGRKNGDENAKSQEVKNH